jgi:hypothetical protein
VLSSLGELGQYLREIDGADGGASFNRLDHRRRARLALQQGQHR